MDFWIFEINSSSCIGTVGFIFHNFEAVAVDAGKHHPTQVQRRRHFLVTLLGFAVYRFRKTPNLKGNQLQIGRNKSGEDQTYVLCHR